jgi:TonB family protein
MTPYNKANPDQPIPSDPHDRGISGGSGVGFAVGTSSATPESHARGRRSPRIAVSIPVALTDHLGNKEETRTNFVTPRGAVLVVKMKVHSGQKVGLRNLKSGRDVECSITSVEMLLKDTHQIELQFAHPQPDFWPVQFPAESSATMAFQHTPEVNLPTEPALISASESLDLSDTVRPKSNSTFAVDHSHFVPVRPEPLAASVVEAKPALGATTQQFSNSAARDSVAQFRAANRAAYRRQQQLKFAYGSLALIAIFVAVVFGRPYLQQHTQAATTSLDAESVVVERPHPRVQRAPVQVERAPAIVAPPPVTEQPQPAARESAATASVPITVAPAEASFHPNAADLARNEAEKAVPEEVSVHHGETTSQTGAADDEPIAFPVKLAEAPSTAVPAPTSTINELVSHGSHVSAVLGSQPTKKVTPLRLISSVSAGYPALARQYRVEGQVVVVAEIDKTGAVTATKVLSGPPMLRESAAAAVRKWKYRPAMLDDKPVPSTDTVTLSFKVH